MGYSTQRVRLCDGSLGGGRLASLFALATRWLLATTPIWCAPLAPARAADGLVSILNGKNLLGWKVIPEKQKRTWTVRDGILVASSDGGGSDLIWEGGKPADFEPKLQVRFRTAGHSGSQVRGRRREGKQRRVNGYRADVGNLVLGPQVLGAWDFRGVARGDYRGGTGQRVRLNQQGVTDFSDLRDAVQPGDIHPRDWNPVPIVVRANRLTSLVHGKIASEVIDEETSNRIGRGVIGMQTHRGSPAVVEFRAVQLKRPVKQVVAEPERLALADLFAGGTAGYHTFRIPSLMVTTKGSLLAICEGRKTSRSDHGDVDLVCRRSVDGGKTWGPIQLIHEQGGTHLITIGNPCPVVDRDRGVVWLPFTRDNTDVLLTASFDDGQTWRKPRVITSSVKRDDWTWYATGPGNGIQLTRGKYAGRLVIPCDHRVRGISDRQKSTRSHVIYSDDHGQTWEMGGVTEFLMNECAVVERSDGSLLLNMRSNRGLRCRAVAISDDGGASWSKCRDQAVLVEPVCQASMVRYSWPADSGPNRLIFSNPASASGRQRLTLRVSYDDGQSWPISRLLYRDSSAYSSLAVLPKRRIGVLFERDAYSRISFAAVSLEYVENAGPSK